MPYNYIQGIWALVCYTKRHTNIGPQILGEYEYRVIRVPATSIGERGFVIASTRVFFLKGYPSSVFQPFCRSCAKVHTDLPSCVLAKSTLYILFVALELVSSAEV